MDANDYNEGLNLYTYNRWRGQAPRLQANGLPSSFPYVDLPTMIPRVHGNPGNLTYFDDVSGQIPYSPAILEMAAHSRGAAPAVKAEQPKAPGLWSKVIGAVFTGHLKTGAQNAATGNQTAATGGAITDTVKLQTPSGDTMRSIMPVTQGRLTV